MRTQIGLVSGVEQWLLCGAHHRRRVRWASSAAALSRRGSTGLGWRDAAALGILMNTRGLMELIVLNIGLDLGVISPTLFAMLVIMAVVTTVMTSPLLLLLMPESSPTIVRSGPRRGGSPNPGEASPRAGE